MKRTLRDAAAAVGGQLVGDDHPFGAVATDSRTLMPGSLFVALRGPNFGYHDNTIQEWRLAADGGVTNAV